MDLVGQRIICDMRDELNQHIQRLSLAFFNRTPTGDILSRVSNDVALVRTALTDAVASVMRDATSLVALIVVAFLKDPTLALIAFLVFPASVLPIVKLSQRLRRFSKRGQRTLGLLTSLLQETVQGNRVVKAFGMEEYERERFQTENRRLYRLYMKASMIKALTTPALEVLAAFAIGGVVWYGGNSVIAGGRSQGSFLAFLTAMFLLYEPFKRLTKSNATIQQGVAGAERVFELLDTAPEVVDRPGARALSAMRRGIVFEHVGFRYGAEPVLKDVNLTIQAGEVVALVGMSGGGKSTLADLIPRFYDVTEGRIAIDGVDIRDYTLALAAGAARDRHPVHVPLQRHRARQHRVRRPREVDGRRRDRGPGRQRPRVHHRAAAGIRHADRRARRDALGRPTAAPRDRARPSEGRADPHPRRGDLGARHRVGAPRAAGDRAAHGEPHHARDRAPALDDPPRRPHRRGVARRRSSRKGRTRSCWRSAPSTGSSTTCSSRIHLPRPSIPSGSCTDGAPALMARARRALLQKLVPLGAWLIAAVLLFLRWTTRKELVNDGGLYERWRAGERLIIAFWHEQLVLMPCFGWWPRVCIMISQHRDGELIARAVRPLGIEAVRGSSTRGGRGALRQILTAYREGASLAWTPDGPRGPRRVAKSGIIHTARATGALDRAGRGGGTMAPPARQLGPHGRAVARHTARVLGRHPDPRRARRHARGARGGARAARA